MTVIFVGVFLSCCAIYLWIYCTNGIALIRSECVVLQRKPSSSSVCCQLWKIPESCVFYTNPLVLFLGDCSHITHGTLVSFVLCLDFSFWYSVLIWVFDKGPVSRTTSFEVESLLSPCFNLSPFDSEVTQLMFDTRKKKWFLLLFFETGRCSGFSLSFAMRTAS